MSLEPVLLLSLALFCTGVYGVLSRKNAIGLLLSVELMVNAVNINFVAFARFHGGHIGQVFAVFAIALTVAEVVVGLALVILLYRGTRDVSVDAVRRLKH
jgi:NADH-quinone oxidoreductase subunit K